VEADDPRNISDEERNIFTLLRDLVLEADPDGDDQQPVSIRFLLVKVFQFNGLNVWASIALDGFWLMVLVTATLSYIFNEVADRLVVQGI